MAIPTANQFAADNVSLLGGPRSGVSGSGSIGQTPYQIIDPSAGSSFASQLGPLLQRLSQLQAPNYQDLVNQGINSPLMQSVLKPALANLQPGEDLARQNFTDEFRKAGALGSGAMGAGSANLERGLQGQRGNLISQVISQMLPQITQGLGQQFNQGLNIDQLMSQVLGMSKPSIVTGSNGAVGGGGGGLSPSLGLQTPMSSESANANYFKTPGYGAGQPDMPGSNSGGNYDLTGLYQPSNLTGQTNNQATYIGPEGYITPGSSTVYNGAGGFEGQTASLAGTGYENENFY